MTAFRRTAALVTLVAYLALSTVGAGWVLCSGADGHSAIESLTASCCAPATDAHADDHLAAACGDSHAPDGDARALDRHEHVPGESDAPHAHQSHAGCDDCEDCGDCEDLSLRDLVRSRPGAQDDVHPIAATAAHATALLPWSGLDARPVVSVPPRAPRPPPERQGIVCTVLRL